MANQLRANGFACSCAACRVRSVRWPLLLIAAGVLFSLDLVMHVVEVWKTWPILLIVWGFTGLATRVAPDAGHGMPPAAAGPFGPPPPAMTPFGAAPENAGPAPQPPPPSSIHDAS